MCEYSRVSRKATDILRVRFGLVSSDVRENETDSRGFSTADFFRVAFSASSGPSAGYPFSHAYRERCGRGNAQENATGSRSGEIGDIESGFVFCLFAPRHVYVCSRSSARREESLPYWRDNDLQLGFNVLRVTSARALLPPRARSALITASLSKQPPQTELDRACRLRAKSGKLGRDKIRVQPRRVLSEILQPRLAYLVEAFAVFFGEIPEIARFLNLDMIRLSLQDHEGSIYRQKLFQKRRRSIRGRAWSFPVKKDVARDEGSVAVMHSCAPACVRTRALHGSPRAMAVVSSPVNARFVIRVSMRARRGSASGSATYAMLRFRDARVRPRMEEIKGERSISDSLDVAATRAGSEPNRIEAATSRIYIIYNI